MDYDGAPVHVIMLTTGETGKEPAHVFARKAHELLGHHNVAVTAVLATHSWSSLREAVPADSRLELDETDGRDLAEAIGCEYATTMTPSTTWTPTSTTTTTSTTDYPSAKKSSKSAKKSSKSAKSAKSNNGKKKGKKN